MIRGTKTAAYTIYGDYPELIKQESMGIVRGRFVNQQDILLKRKVAVIGEGVIKDFVYANGRSVGTYVKVNGVNFMVVGVYNSKFQE